MQDNLEKSRSAAVNDLTMRTLPGAGQWCHRKAVLRWEDQVLGFTADELKLSAGERQGA